MTHPKFKALSEAKIGIVIALGVELRRKLAKLNIWHSKYRKKIILIRGTSR